MAEPEQQNTEQVVVAVAAWGAAMQTRVDATYTALGVWWEGLSPEARAQLEALMQAAVEAD